MRETRRNDAFRKAQSTRILLPPQIRNSILYTKSGKTLSCYFTIGEQNWGIQHHSIANGVIFLSVRLRLAFERENVPLCKTRELDCTALPALSPVGSFRTKFWCRTCEQHKKLKFIIYDATQNWNNWMSCIETFWERPEHQNLFH